MVLLLSLFLLTARACQYYVRGSIYAAYKILIIPQNISQTGKFDNIRDSATSYITCAASGDVEVTYTPLACGRITQWIRLRPAITARQGLTTLP